jgi:hypothetical protein
LRADASFPVGALAGDGTQLTIKGIATRGWGRTRVHLNAAYTFGVEQSTSAIEAADNWWYGLAADRTLFRHSLLVIAELYALRSVPGDPVQVNGTIGLRRQVTPYLVLDVGLAHGFRDEAGPEYEITVGLSRSFAVAGLIGVGR